MPRRNRSIAGLCIAVIVLAALLPGIGSFDWTFLEPQWILLPDEVSVVADILVPACDEQPVPLLSLVTSRGPPPRSLA
jgi:hypothetical protein